MIVVIGSSSKGDCSGISKSSDVVVENTSTTIVVVVRDVKPTSSDSTHAHVSPPADHYMMTIVAKFQ